MKRFEFLVLLAIIQMGVLMTGYVEIQSGTYMYTVYSDSVLGTAMVNVGNQLEDVKINVGLVSNTSLVKSQTIDVTIPFISNITFVPPNVVFSSASVARFDVPNPNNLFGVLSSMGQIFLNISWLLLIILFQVTIGSVLFYEMVLLALLPNPELATTKINVYLFAFILALIQSVLVMYEIIKSIKSIQAMSTGVSVNFSEDEEGIKRGGGRGLPYSEAGGLE